MAKKNLKIRQGDADTLEETITGLDSLSGYSAKMFIYTRAGVLYETLTGTISGLVITYEIVNEDSKAYAVNRYKYETKIWDASDHVYTPSWGDFIVETTLNNDPS